MILRISAERSEVMTENRGYYDEYYWWQIEEGLGRQDGVAQSIEGLWVW